MSRRRRRLRRLRNRRTAILIACAAALVLVVVAIGATVALGSSCDLNSLTPVAVGQNTVVYAADGSELGVIPADRNRTPVEDSQISPWLPKATVAIEDRRFYSHGGIDPIGIIRALITDIREFRFAEGGSTITQELVRNLYLTRQRTIQRKIVEACLAIKLARHWSKAHILNAYENEVYYGNHAYGIEAAAETYFSKPARTLTLDQAALLAGLPQAPSIYDPFVRPQDALDRRDQVLRAMLRSDYISQAQYDRASADRALHLNPGARYTAIREPYFFSYVEDLLTAEYGTNTVREGGLRVYTTIDSALQSAATAAITHTLNESTDPASAIVSIDPSSGAIRAMTAVTPGSTGNQFNFVTSGARQPGSTFKAVALTTAVSEGMDPFHTYYLSAPFYDPELKWNVQTYDHTYAGVESVANATLQSDNTVYARLSLDVGPQNIVDMARKLGIRTSKLEPFPSIALGSESVTPLEEASAYSTIAAGGVYSTPMAITKVVLPTGNADKSAGWGKPSRERVIPDWVASTVTQVLEQNMLAGTGRGAHIAGRTDAGKTGTTDNYADAWFSGFTPTLEATVWIGYPRGEIPMLDVHGIAVSGPTFPATIWHLFMETVTAHTKDVPFPQPTSQPQWINWHGKVAYGLVYGTTTTTVAQPKPVTDTTPVVTVTLPEQTLTTPTTTTEPAPTTTTTEPAPTTTSP